MKWGLGQAFWEGVPQPQGSGPKALTLAEKLQAAILELREQPAHTRAHKTVTASQNPQKSGLQGQVLPVDRHSSSSF